jgi:hypothetical protein
MLEPNRSLMEDRMFALSRKTNSAQAEERPKPKVTEQEQVVVIQFPTSQIPRRLVEVQKQRSYEDVAQSLGFMPPQLTRAQLLEFFETEGINVYDYDQVKAWLTKKKIEAKAENWCWRPLREKDIISGYRWGYNREKGTWNDGFYCSTQKSWECRPYALLVPQHALEKVAKIEGKFGDQVKFFVSDYARPDGDPFIMVRPSKCDDGGAEYNLVFDAWDEPGFGA